MLVARSLLLGALAVTAATGCASQGPDERTGEDEAELKRALHGIVVIERLDSADGARSSVSAKFVRVTPHERELTERLIGTRPAIPGPSECVPLDALEQAEAKVQRTVVWADRLRPEAPSDPRLGPLAARGVRDVELIDVGDVRLLTQGDDGAPVAFGLAPRAFPDVGDLASGMFYTSPDTEQPLPSPARFELSGTGSDLLDAFAIDVSAPPHLTELSVAGRATDPAIPVEVARGDLDLAWSTAEAATDRSANDLVYIDVRAGDTAFRCTFADQGAATMPAEVLGDAVGAEITITVHRLAERTTSIEQGAGVLASGLPASGAVGDATVRFDLARSVRLTTR